MSTDQVLLGVGLTLVLAVGSQILASRLRLPALIVLLPVGFAAGAATDVVHPDRLLGPAFEPLVGLAVAIILYDAGLGLDLRELTGHPRRIVRRLVGLGVPLTFALAALAAAPLLDLSRGAALMLGAIIVVSGPTVVGPLLDFVRPAERVRRILSWEGAVIDPVGAIVGAVVFNVVAVAFQPGLHGPGAQFLASMLVGLAGGAVGTVVLYLLLRRLELGEVLGTTAQLAVVVAVAALCDIVLDDTGLIAAIAMGLAAANFRAFDVPARRPFFETLVQLILGLLFVSISTTVSPASLRHVILPTLGLVAFLVLVVRPLVALVSTMRTDVTWPERAFLGWMAPRGIVAAATASTFSLSLVDKGIGGAEKILPATFLVIVATVTLYGLTAAPVARRLGVNLPARSRPLLVGGDAFVVDLARALRSAGIEPVLWAGQRAERDRIVDAGFTLVPGELLAAATAGVRLEGITSVLLLTRDDDFNALASMMISDTVDGPVYRLAPPAADHGVVAPYTGGDLLFPAINRSYVDGRYASGATISTHAADHVPDGAEVLFVVHHDLRLEPASDDVRPETGDTLVLLTPGS
jgi:NhaP-type Na+/H+ or K+/H+ antiporter